LCLNQNNRHPPVSQDITYVCNSGVLFNARSLKNKLPDLHAVINQRFKMIFVTESWLNETVTDNMIDCSNQYAVYRCDRVNRRGGGVLSLVCKTCVSYQVFLPAKFSGLELICFDVLNCDTSTRYVLVYRPPEFNSLGREYITLLVECLEFLFAVNYSVVLLGDFNLPHINWDTLVAPQDNVHDAFVNFCVYNGLYQFVGEPTRGDNCVDIVLSNDQHIISSLAVVDHFSTSDHCSIEFSVIAHSDDIIRTNGCDPSPTKTYLDFDAADYDSINLLISSHPFQFQSSDNLPTDPNDLWDAFVSPLNSAINQFVPVKTSSKSRHNTKRKKYPRHIRRALNKKLLLWRRHRRLNTVDSKLAYNRQASLCRKLLYDYEKSQELAIIKRNNIGSFYRFINRKLSCKTGVSPLKSTSGGIITDDTGKATALNEYFCNVFTADDQNIPEFTRRVGDDISMSSVTFSSYSVFKTLTKCKTSRSLDPDGFSISFVKKLKSTLAYPLAVLFTHIFECGVIPDAWRVAHVTPVHKKGVSSSVENYRPISLTSVICKLFERIVKEQMLDYLRKYNLITRHQHGFLSQHSTTTELLETLNDWTLALRNKHVVDAIYFDFSKAFDSVVHTKLRVKLQGYGFDGKLYGILSDFLHNRIQRVVLPDGASSYDFVSSGVPQGSVLGPLLFLIYVNDVADLFTDGSCVKMYADDVKLYLEIENDSNVAMLQQNIDKFVKWAQTWQLSLSSQKCCHMRIGLLAANNPVDYHVDHVVLNTVDKVRDLGIYIDSKLKFAEHINLMVAKAHRRANQILRCFLSRDNEILVKAFVTYVRPILEYSSPVWSPHTLGMINSIESVQRRFTKKLCGMSSLSYDERCTCLRLDRLELRRLHCDVLTCFKIFRGFNCLKLHEFFTPCGEHITRGHPFKFRVQQYRIDARKYFFSSRVVNIWNQLPVEIFNVVTAAAFAAGLRSCNLSHYLLGSK